MRKNKIKKTSKKRKKLIENGKETGFHLILFREDEEGGVRELWIIGS